MSIGFARQGRPNAPRSASAAPVIHLASEADLARVKREQIDPFGLAFACKSAGGHEPISVGEAIVCFHCSRIFTP